MTTKSISLRDLKSRLADVLRVVRGGRTVLITDRGRPVARLVPIEPLPGDVQALVEAGLVREGRRALPKAFLDRARPSDPDGSLREAVMDERGVGR